MRKARLTCIGMVLLMVTLLSSSALAASTAGGSYTYNSVNSLLTLNWLSSNFACEGPTLGVETLTVTLTATTLSWTDGIDTMFWTRTSGTSGSIVGSWSSTDSGTGNSWLLTFNPDGSVTVSGSVYQCGDSGNGTTVTLGSAGVTHRVMADGNLFDTLDAVINTAATTLGTMTLTVTGPEGFPPYTFVDADIRPHFNNTLLVYKQYPSLPAGIYTFTLNDGNGHISNRVDAHVTVNHNLFRVDSTTIQLQRKADGSYRFSWAPLNDTQTNSYRLRIERADNSNAPLYMSSRQMTTFIDVPAGTMVDGTAYRARMEAYDSSSHDLVTNRSDSAFVNFTPQSVDYSPSRLLFSYASANSQIETDGTQKAVFGFGVGSSAAAAAAAVTSAVVTGPNGFSYTFQPADLLQPNGTDFYHAFTTFPATGTYTFHVLANGLDHYAYATLTPTVVYPLPDSATYQAQDLGNGNIRFSWADVNYSGALYYRVQAKDSITGRYINSPRLNKTNTDMAKIALGDLTNLQWRVEVFDSSFPNTQRNRRNGPWTIGTLASLPPFGAGRPVNAAYLFANLTPPGGGGATELWSVPADTDGTIATLRVDGPNGYSRNLLTQGWNFNGIYGITDMNSPTTGLYTYTVMDNAGKTAVNYNFQPVPHPVPAVDYHTFHVNAELNGDLRFSWAPVVSDVPIWYYVEIWGTNVLLNLSSIAAATSVVIPASWLQGQVMFWVKALDASDNTAVNNFSTSAMIGYQGPGFNYVGLTDNDGDGIASNADANDNDPNINPFAPNLTANIIGSGSINNTTQPPPFSCSSPSSACSSTFQVGASLTLHASPAANHIFAGWTGGCDNINGAGDCVIASLNTDTAVTAVFNQLQYIRIGSSYYSMLQYGFDAVANNEIIQARAQTFTETGLIFNRPAAQVKFKGGYDDSFATNSGYTILDGKLSIRGGTLRLDKLKIR